MKHKVVSVIITTKNSSRTLKACLSSIRKQTYIHHEIIVVDNKSEDNTLSIAHEFTDSVFIKGPERSNQRNYGASKARGQFVLFMDSDMYLSPRVLEACIDMYEKYDLIGIYIPEKMIGTSFWSQVRNFERQFYNDTPIDAVRFMKKADFDKIGGFDESLVGSEDWDLDRRLREMGKTKRISPTLYHDEGDHSFTDLVKKKQGYSENMKLYIKKWGEQDPIIQKQLGFRYRFVTVFTENRKWTKLLKNPHLAISLYILKAVQGFFFLVRRVS